MTAAYMLVGDTLFFGSHRRHDTYMRCGYAHAQDEYADMQYLSTQSTSPVRIEYLQMYEKAWIEYRRVYEKEWMESSREDEKEWIEFQRKYDNARIKSQQKCEKAWIESQQMYDKAWSECRRNYEKEWLESRRKYENAWIEFQQKYEQPMIASQQKYEQASEHRKKSIQDARNKPAQQHRQLSQSHHQTLPQHKQGLEELVDKFSYPLLSKDAGTVPSSLPESESSGSREDGDKTSEDHGRRRKRVKHDDIKKEPVDETMSDAATASASFSTITSTASTTSSFSTSSGHIVADVTLDMQNKLNFNPTTAIFQ
ncbi:hypothetical protein KI688_007748 [Linnemannia hyalina]|uniref:Uncharacterized protein n=1 Tax=Linnemannia hyalina TaxID=64524 RepID=A0A9P8BM01_9FUNG|nr:hypothetical protein KI688_007748 [Linnemannia hyalina]